MSTAPKSVIHINFIAGALVFDARPIWNALQTAVKNGKLSAELFDSIHARFDESAIHLGTRHYLLALAVGRFKISLIELSKLVPEQWLPPSNGYQVVSGEDWDHFRDSALMAVEVFLYEFRAFLDLLAAFSFGILRKVGKAPGPIVKLADGEEIEVSNAGKVCSHDFLRYMCEQLNVSVDWFTFLTRHRNFFTHRGAPYCAIEDRLMIPKEYDLLIMRRNIKDFSSADPGDYFRVSECQAVVTGAVSLSRALQKHILDMLSA